MNLVEVWFEEKIILKLGSFINYDVDWNLEEDQKKLVENIVVHCLLVGNN